MPVAAQSDEPKCRRCGRTGSVLENGILLCGECFYVTSFSLHMLSRAIWDGLSSDSLENLARTLREVVTGLEDTLRERTQDEFAAQSDGGR